MEEILVLILQFVIEFFASAFSYPPLDWTTRGRKTPESENLWVWCSCLFLIAGGIAWLSTMVFAHSFISSPALRMLNVVLAPIASAYISQAITRRRSINNPNLIPRHHFWQAFWFTLGLVLVRFVYVSR